jgi:hypothetical protein
MATSTKARNVGSISVSLNPKKQNLETTNQMVKLILGRAGCDACGRIACFDAHFLGDPEPDFEKLGAVSVDVRTR